jgi:ribose-phosphate pyrophosphokinase
MTLMPVSARKKFCLLTGSTHPALAENVAKRLGLPLTPVTVKNFKVGEIHTKIEESVRNKHAFVISTANTGRINDDLMETKILLQTLSLASCGNIDLLMLAMPYLRQDRKDEPRVPITAVLAVQELYQASGGKLRSLITFDPHTVGAEAIMRAVGITAPAALTTKALFVDYIKKNFPLENLMFVATDSGRIKWVRSWAKAIYGPDEFLLHYLPAEKIGNGDDSIVSICEREVSLKRSVGESSFNIYPKVSLRHKHVFMVDDMIDGGGTMISTAMEIAKYSPAYIFAAGVHPYLSGKAAEKLQKSPIEQVIVASTLNIPESSLFPKLKVLDVSPLVAEIISRIATNRSLEGYSLSI